jgi:hypothetical protein
VSRGFGGQFVLCLRPPSDGNYFSKQNKLSEDDLQAASDSTVDSVGRDPRYFRALEALSALKLVLRHQTLGATSSIAWMR